jgi:hypothetical protein
MTQSGSAALLDIRFRPYQSGDETGVRQLFQTCHARELPADEWQWRYREGPVGEAIVTVGEAGSEVIAHWACLPVTLHKGSESMAAGLGMDLMVHPAFRNATLFVRLAEAHHERCLKAGLRILFGFPNDHSYLPLCRMLDWRPIEEIDAFDASQDALRVGGAACHAWRIDPIVDFTPEFSAFWEQIRPKNEWAGARYHSWLQWRFRRRPLRRYPAWSARDDRGRLVGWLVAKVFRGTQAPIGDVVDFWFSEKDVALALFSAALDAFDAANVRTVSAWALAGTALYGMWVDWGLAPRGPRTHFAGRWTEASETAAFPDRGADWCVQKADSDVF